MAKLLQKLHSQKCSGQHFFLGHLPPRNTESGVKHRIPISRPASVRVMCFSSLGRTNQGRRWGLAATDETILRSDRGATLEAFESCAFRSIGFPDVVSQARQYSSHNNEWMV